MTIYSKPTLDEIWTNLNLPKLEDLQFNKFWLLIDDDASTEVRVRLA